MGSIAIWYETKKKSQDANQPRECFAKRKRSDTECAGDEDKRPKLDLHFNLWYEYVKSQPDNKNCPVLDIGIMIYGFKDIKKLSMVFPESFSSQCVSDLGSLLNDDTTLNAVFNDNHRIVNRGGGKAFSVERCLPGVEGKSAERFLVYCVDTSRDLEVKTEGFDGYGRYTQIDISFERLVDLTEEMKEVGIENCYFRLRLQCPAVERMVVRTSNQSFTDALFHDVLYATNVLNCQVNRSRSIPPSIRETVRGCKGFPPINRVDFLLLTNGSVDLINDHHATVRYLEKKVWEKYLPLSGNGNAIETDNVIAYHWKQTDGIHYDFDLFSKFRVAKRNKKTIAIYIGAALALGFLGNLLYAVIPGRLFSILSWLID